MAGYRLAWNLEQRGGNEHRVSLSFFCSYNARLQPPVRIHAKRRTADLLRFQLSTETGITSAQAFNCPRKAKNFFTHVSTSVRKGSIALSSLAARFGASA